MSTPLGQILTTTQMDTAADVDTKIAASAATLQPLDSDLTAIAALTPSNDDFIQRKAGAWTNRTIAQVKTDLSITTPDILRTALTCASLRL